MENFNTHRANVKGHLETKGNITSWEAISLYRCTRLSAIICVLKNDYDMPIETEMVYEDKKRYARYWLKKEE